MLCQSQCATKARRNSIPITEQLRRLLLFCLCFLTSAQRSASCWNKQNTPLHRLSAQSLKETRGQTRSLMKTLLKTRYTLTWLLASELSTPIRLISTIRRTLHSSFRKLHRLTMLSATITPHLSITCLIIAATITRCFFKTLLPALMKYNRHLNRNLCTKCQITSVLLT